MQILNYSPGSKATIFLEVNDGYSEVRVDAIGTPVVNSILLPDFTNDGYDGYSIPLTHLDTGLYAFQFQIPRGASAVGSYFVSVSYIHPISLQTNTRGFQLIVSAPFGLYGTSVPTI